MQDDAARPKALQVRLAVFECRAMTIGSSHKDISSVDLAF